MTQKLGDILQKLSEWIGGLIQALVRWGMALYAKPKPHPQAVWPGDYCEACGDCILCYGEDPCQNTPDGIHVAPTDEEML
jgi:hypothetical protein